MESCKKIKFRKIFDIMFLRGDNLFIIISKVTGISIFYATIMTFVALSFINKISPSTFIFIVLFLSINFCVTYGIEMSKQRNITKSILYGVDFSILLLGAISIIGVLNIGNDILQKKLNFYTSETEYYSKESVIRIKDIQESWCKNNDKSAHYCLKLEKIANELSNGFANIKWQRERINQDLNFILKDKYLMKIESETSELRTILYHLDKYDKKSRLLLDVQKRVNEVKKDNGVLIDWIDISSFKLFLTFIASMALSIKLGLIVYKYHSESQPLKYKTKNDKPLNNTRINA